MGFLCYNPLCCVINELSVMLGKCGFRFDRETPIQEIELKKINIILGDNKFYTNVCFNFLKSLFQYKERYFKGGYRNQFIYDYFCDTDGFKFNHNDGLVEDKRDFQMVKSFRQTFRNSSIINSEIRSTEENRKVCFILDCVDGGLDCKESVELTKSIGRNINCGLQTLIRTFNPYFLNYFNVLLLKGEISKDDISVYKVRNDGVIYSLLSTNTDFINTEYLSEPMNEIYDEYEELIKQGYGK